LGSGGAPGRTPLAALRHRDFRVLWIGLLISTFGSQFTTIAMAWQIYELTNSPLQLGLLGLARGIPMLLLLLYGGVLADALDRRRLMMFMQVTQFGVTAVMALLTFSGGITPTALYVGSVLLAVFAALEGPSRQAIIPNLVPRAELASAVALNSTQRQVATIAGPSIAGLVLAAGGAEICYAVDAASWLVMLVALVLISGQTQQRSERRSFGFRSLGEGFSFVWANPVILALMALDLGQNLFGMPRALFPVYAKDILQVGPEGLGLMYAAASIGAIGVAVGMSFIGNVRRAGRIVLIGVAIHAICIVLFAYSHLFWFSILMLAGEGLGNAFSAILRNTINQLLTPDTLRGRVSSVNSMFTNTGPQLGQFRAGAIAEVVGPELSLFSGGLAILALVGIVGAKRAVRTFELPTVELASPGQPAAARF
jgi:MFS family permease